MQRSRYLKKSLKASILLDHSILRVATIRYINSEAFPPKKDTITGKLRESAQHYPPQRPRPLMNYSNLLSKLGVVPTQSGESTP
jgi:hypothetical protein